MNAVKDHADHPINDPEWYFFEEYVLEKLPAGLEGTSEDVYRLERIEGLVMDAGLLNEIENKVITLTRDALARHDHDRCKTQTTIRLFIQKRAIGEVTLIRSSIQIEAGKNRKNLPRARKTGHGGWGYFLVERGGGFKHDSSVSNLLSIDLYLYKEGE